MNFINSKARYRDQRKAAQKRNIPFNLTFEEWYNWYLSHGIDKNIPQKMNRNAWCMCRFNDEGPYELGNIYLDTNSNNASLGNRLRAQRKINTSSAA